MTIHENFAWGKLDSQPILENLFLFCWECLSCPFWILDQITHHVMPIVFGERHYYDAQRMRDNLAVIVAPVEKGTEDCKYQCSLKCIKFWPNKMSSKLNPNTNVGSLYCFREFVTNLVQALDCFLWFSMNRLVYGLNKAVKFPIILTLGLTAAHINVLLDFNLKSYLP